MKDRYIGITGFKTKDEVWRTATYFKAISKDTLNTFGTFNRLMLGILSSSKRLDSLLAGKEDEGKRSPKISAIPGLLREIDDYSYVFPVIHYHTQNPNFAGEIAQILGYEKMWEFGLCNAVQLNMTWPNPEVMRFTQGMFPGLEFILPITSKAIDTMTPAQIADKAQGYETLANYILVDGSGGRGIELDTNKLADIIGWLKDKMPDTMIGVAGGLHGENLTEKLEPITAKFGKSICVDAEGKLRTLDDKELDWDACVKYINASMAYLG